MEGHAEGKEWRPVYLRYETGLMQVFHLYPLIIQELIRRRRIQSPVQRHKKSDKNGIHSKSGAPSQSVLFHYNRMRSGCCPNCSYDDGTQLSPSEINMRREAIMTVFYFFLKSLYKDRRILRIGKQIFYARDHRYGNILGLYKFIMMANFNFKLNIIRIDDQI